MATANSVMGGFARIGRVRANVTSVLMLVCAVVLLVAGVIFFFMKDKSVTVSTKVAKVASCTLVVPRDRSSYYDCDVTLKYTYGGKKYTTQTSLKASRRIQEGSSQKVRINPSAPDKVLDRPAFNTIAYVSSGVAAVCLVCALVQHLIAKSNTASTAYGAKTLFNVF